MRYERGFSLTSLALADVDVLVDVVWHVVEGLARVRRASCPVVASLLRVGFLRVIEVDVRRVTEHHLRMTSHIVHVRRAVIH